MVNLAVIKSAEQVSEQKITTRVVAQNGIAALGGRKSFNFRARTDKVLWNCCNTFSYKILVKKKARTTRFL